MTDLAQEPTNTRIATGVIGLDADAGIAVPGGSTTAGALASGTAVTLWDGSTGRVGWVYRQDGGTSEASGQAVRIARGALGNGLPHRDVRVPPHHRVLLARPGVQALVPAKALIGRRGIALDADDAPRASILVLLDRHGVLRVDGAGFESFYPGRLGLARLPDAARTALFALYSGLQTSVLRAYGPPAYPILNGFEIDQALETLGNQALQARAGWDYLAA